MVMESLADYLATHKPAGFRSEVKYFKHGDFLTYFVKSELFYAERQDDSLTVYRSEATHELIGCKLKGVRALVEKMGTFSFAVSEGKKTKLGPLLVTAAMVSNRDMRGQYLSCASQLGTADVDVSNVATTAA